MSIRFQTPDGAVHDSGLSEPQLNLLAHAQAIELDIGSQCGGHGICGGDRIRIPMERMDELSPVSESEREHLREDELQAGYRLACQCFPDRTSGTIELIVRIANI